MKIIDSLMLCRNDFVYLYLVVRSEEVLIY